MQLILGTANFNKKYGLLKNKINFKNIKRIEKFFNIIDTAISYKNDNFLIKLNLKKKKLITKINLNNNTNIKKTIHELKKKLKLYKKSQYHGILIHNSINIENFKKYNLLKKILLLKKNKISKKIGISIYSPKELKIMKEWKPEIIQFPYNIFDQRFSDKILMTLKKNNIELHARSCFLQGILINNKNKIFKKYPNNFKKFNDWCKKKNISQTEAAINFCKQNKFIDYLILGIDSLDQAKNNYKSFVKNKIIVKSFKTNNLNIIDPRKW